MHVALAGVLYYAAERYVRIYVLQVNSADVVCDNTHSQEKRYP